MEKIEGIPEGYRLVAIRPPRKGDEYVNSNGRAVSAQENFVTVYPIIEKIGPVYRPFKNADEFKPFRDKWLVDEAGAHHRVVAFCKTMIKIDDDVNGCGWLELRNRFRFEDGTPCGLPVIEGE